MNPSCRRFIFRLQFCTVSIVLRILHAGLVELCRCDERVRGEVRGMPDGMSFAIEAAPAGPTLCVKTTQGQLARQNWNENAHCILRIKSMAYAFRLFTGQMGLARAFVEHGFTMKGEIADVMRLTRLVHVAEAHLFPHFMTRRIMTDVPARSCSMVGLYARIACGFLTNRYSQTKA